MEKEFTRILIKQLYDTSLYLHVNNFKMKLNFNLANHIKMSTMQLTWENSKKLPSMQLASSDFS